MIKRTSKADFERNVGERRKWDSGIKGIEEYVKG
jgi:hypothetical protein